MSLLNKIEGYGTLAIAAIVGYLAWSNWDKIIAGFCKIPGAPATGWCGDSSDALNCKLTMNDCWTSTGPHATVDTINCKCIASDLDKPPQIINECAVVGQIDCSYFPPKRCVDTPIGRTWVGDLLANCGDSGLRCWCNSVPHDLTQEQAVQYHQNCNEFCSTIKTRESQLCNGVPVWSDELWINFGGSCEQWQKGNELGGGNPPNTPCSIGQTRCVDTYLERCRQASYGLDWFSTGERCNYTQPTDPGPTPTEVNQSQCIRDYIGTQPIINGTVCGMDMSMEGYYKTPGGCWMHPVLYMAWQNCGGFP